MGVMSLHFLQFVPAAEWECRITEIFESMIEVKNGNYVV